MMHGQKNIKLKTQVVPRSKHPPSRL